MIGMLVDTIFLRAPLPYHYAHGTCRPQGKGGRG